MHPHLLNKHYSPVEAVDCSVTKAVDHPTGRASLTPLRMVDKGHRAIGKSHYSSLSLTLNASMSTYGSVVSGEMFIKT